MEEQIKTIAKKEFDAEVIKIKKITEGYSHYMYNVRINKEPYELIFRFSNNKKKDVNLAKEKYVMEVMSKNNLPIPKIYAFDNSKKESSEEYMVLEKMSGIRLDTIWDSMTKEEKTQVTEEIGKILSKIHSIKFEEFGYIREGGEIDFDVAFRFKQMGDPLTHSRYLRGELKDYFINFSRLISYRHLPKEFFRNYMDFLHKNLETLDYSEKPVLIHSDFMTGHLFVKKDNSVYKIVGLIDFELAKASAPQGDFIKLHRQGFFDDPDLKEALKKGYGKINEKAVEILRILRDISFAQVLFESGNKELAAKIIGETDEKIKKELSKN